MLLHDVLRGVKMATIIENRAPTTPAAGVRSGMLPPISREESSEMNSNGSGSSNNNSNNNNNNSNNNSIYVHVSFSLC